MNTNANSGLRNSLLSITRNQEVIDLRLDPATLARRDQFMQTGFVARYVSPLRWLTNGQTQDQTQGQSIEWSMAARQRNYQHEFSYNHLELNSALTLHHPTTLSDASIDIVGELLRSGRAASIVCFANGIESGASR